MVFCSLRWIKKHIYGTQQRSEHMHYNHKRLETSPGLLNMVNTKKGYEKGTYTVCKSGAHLLFSVKNINSLDEQWLGESGAAHEANWCWHVEPLASLYSLRSRASCQIWYSCTLLIPPLKIQEELFSWPHWSNHKCLAHYSYLPDKLISESCKSDYKNLKRTIRVCADMWVKLYDT